MNDLGHDAGTPVVVGLRRLPPLTTVALHIRGPYWKLSAARSRLRGRLDDAGIEPTGPLFGLFHDDPAEVPPEETRYTLCYPVDPTDVEAARERLRGRTEGRSLGSPSAASPGVPAPGTSAPGASGPAGPDTDTIELLDFPAATAATAEYRGPAADSPAVYAQIEAWIAEQGYAADGPPREVYLAEPGTLGKGLMHAEVQQPVLRPQAPGGR